MNRLILSALLLFSSLELMAQTKLDSSQKMYFDPFEKKFVAHEVPTACQEKVLLYHAQIYHRYYKLASITFTSNFFNRMVHKAHLLGYPTIALGGPSIINGVSNFIGEKWINYGNKLNVESFEIAGLYLHYLRTEELCRVLGDKYKDYHQVKDFIYQKIDEFSITKKQRH